MTLEGTFWKDDWDGWVLTRGTSRRLQCKPQVEGGTLLRWRAPDPELHFSKAVVLFVWCRAPGDCSTLTRNHTSAVTRREPFVQSNKKRSHLPESPGQKRAWTKLDITGSEAAILQKHILGCSMGFSFSFFSSEVSDVEPIKGRHFPNTKWENAVEPSEVNCKKTQSCGKKNAFSPQWGYVFHSFLIALDLWSMTVANLGCWNLRWCRGRVAARPLPPP